jgi:uncharacterized lipoprotein YmbA
MKTLLLSLTIPFLAVACNVLEPVKDTSVHHLLDPSIPDRRITGATPAIAIARPALPSYLDRQQLVSRASDGQLNMNSYHLWSEPFDSAISRVTAVNLGRLTNSLNIQPVENFITLDYQTLLEIRIARFEPDASGTLVLECTWKLQPVAGRVASTQPFRTTVPIAPTESATDLSGRIAAMNEALARLARDIARSL